MKRTYIQGAAAGATAVRGDAFHYLVHVLRVKSGELLEVFDGVGGNYHAVVTSISADELVIQVGDRHATEPERPIIILLSIVKPARFEWALEKCTELGVSEFRPIHAHRSVARGEGVAKLQRWEAIVREAARQSGRARLPTVRAPAPLQQAVEALDAATQLLVLALDGAEFTPPQAAVAFAVGPEGGWAAADYEALYPRGHPVRLGNRTLRSETAAVAAVSRMG